MITFTVAYNPPISHESQKLIAESVTPSMISNDGDSAQYAIDSVLKQVIIEEDLALLQSLDVSYVEF